MLAGVPPSAGQCRFVRVISVLIFPGAPELCWFCVAPERTGHPRSQRSAEQAFTLDAGRVTVAPALDQASICAYLLLARTHSQPVIDGRSQSVTHGMGVLEQKIARNADPCACPLACLRGIARSEDPVLCPAALRRWRWHALSCGPSRRAACGDSRHHAGCLRSTWSQPQARWFFITRRIRGLPG
jgi:hypothetical protein